MKILRKTWRFLTSRISIRTWCSSLTTRTRESINCQFSHTLNFQESLVRDFSLSWIWMATAILIWRSSFTAFSKYTIQTWKLRLNWPLMFTILIRTGSSGKKMFVWFCLMCQSTKLNLKFRQRVASPWTEVEKTCLSIVLKARMKFTNSLKRFLARELRFPSKSFKKSWKKWPLRCSSTSLSWFKAHYPAVRTSSATRRIMKNLWEIQVTESTEGLQEVLPRVTKSAQCQEIPLRAAQ